jgi:hypothetical protein
MSANLLLIQIVATQSKLSHKKASPLGGTADAASFKTAIVLIGTED